MTEKVKISRPPKQFNKVRLLQILGLLSRKFNYETLEFEPSWSLRLLSLISPISTSLFAFKFFISTFFSRNDIRQLYIGSIFNFLPDQQSRLVWGVVVS